MNGLVPAWVCEGEGEEGLGVQAGSREQGQIMSCFRQGSQAAGGW